MNDRRLNSIQRIIITSKGIEVQNQLRDQLMREDIAPNQKTSRNENEKQLHEEYCQFLLTQPNASEQLEKYSSIVKNRLQSPEEIFKYLQTKLRSNSTEIKVKFIERQLEKASQTIFKNSNKKDKVSKSLPFLDFRQTQYLRSKYKNQMKASGLYQLNVQTNHLHQDSIQRTVMCSDPTNPPNTWESGPQKVTQMMFQESKLERMIHKYQKYKAKTCSQPRFDEVYRRNILQQPKFMQDLHKAEKETRVETLQELNARLMDKMSILNYETQIKVRQRQIMSELHSTKYVKSWIKRRFPGEELNQ